MQSSMFDDEVPSIAPLKTGRVSTLPLFSVQLIREGRENYDLPNLTVRTPADAAKIARQLIENQSREYLLVLILDTKNNVRAAHICTVGILDASLVHPREVFQAAILANAASIILAHNHPSGNPEPSPQDRSVTHRIAEAGKIMGVELLDHVVIGHDGAFVSLKERGVL